MIDAMGKTAKTQASLSSPSTVTRFLTTLPSRSTSIIVTALVPGILGSRAWPLAGLVESAGSIRDDLAVFISGGVPS
ncbi:hypothetical protein [Mycolicibacterium goodii]|uniref:hypothetical protein n=1 Tax=Mycolicibacterium goodii TaxID=134601 RepID=UPI001BDD9F57|nr:hypothetical protein [Mycolicibacterium goodii]MBU8841575.1 hypothetical protein [Mycolicibacterium goodii]